MTEVEDYVLLNKKIHVTQLDREFINEVQDDTKRQVMACDRSELLLFGKLIKLKQAQTRV